MGKSKSITVGYKYYIGLHMGISRGPVNELMEIRVGDRQAWKANPLSPVTDNTTLNIDKEELFGGEKAEGGIKGQAELMFGGSTQTVSSKLKAMLGSADLQPEFRGIFTIFYDGLISAMNPYPKKWKFLVRRTTAGWDAPGAWYPSKAAIEMPGTAPEVAPRTIVAMNPAHMVYEAITNKSWGRGMDPSRIDSIAWRDAADTLYDEGFGLCMRWNRSDTLTQFIQMVLDHIGAVLYVDKTTGLYTIKLLRQDYDVEQLPIYTTDNGLLEITEASSGDTSTSVNEVVVKWHNPLDDTEGQIRVHNLAAVQTTGEVITESRSYPGIPNAILASKVAQRDLRAGAINLRRFKLVADRRLWKIQPGDVFRISDPARKISQVVVRVGEVEDGVITDGKIRITAVQDVFAFRLNTFAGIQDPLAPIPDFSPVVKRHVAYERPYTELNGEYPKAEFAYISDTACFYTQHLERGSDLTMGYDTHVELVDNPDYVSTPAKGQFSPVCTLVETIEYLDTQLVYDTDTDMEDIQIGTAVLLGEVEFAKVTAVDMENKTVDIERGTVDTRPHRHLAGTQIWFVFDSGASDYVEYAPSEEMILRGYPWSFQGGTVTEAQAAMDELTMNMRFYRPYLPGNVLAKSISTPQTNWFNTIEMHYDSGGYFDEEQNYIEVPDVFTLNWSHRDRVQQADQLIPHQGGNIGPEPGTTYRIQVLDSGGNVVRTVNDIIGTEWTYTYGMASNDLDVENQPSSPVTGIVRIHAMRDGVESWQYYDITLAVYNQADANLEMQTVQVSQMTLTDSETKEAGSGTTTTQTTQNIMSDSPDDEDIQGVYTTQTNQMTVGDSVYPTSFTCVSFESPYILLLREGRNLHKSNLRVCASGPPDKIVEQYHLRDRLYTEEGYDGFVDQGIYGFSPWVTIKPCGYLDNELLVAPELVQTQAGTSPTGQPVYTWEEDVTKPLTSERVGAYVEVNFTPGMLAIMDGEVVEVTGITQNQYGVERIQVRRGCADTIPQAHGKVDLWFFERNPAVSNRPWDGYAIAQYALQPVVFGPPVALETLNFYTQYMRDRTPRPYPPGLLLVNGEHWFTARDTFQPGWDLQLTWAHRNKTWQADTAYDHLNVGIPKDPGVTYYVVFMKGRGENESVLKVYTIEGNSLTIPNDELLEMQRETDLALWQQKSGPKDPFVWDGKGPLSCEIYAVKDGRTSWQSYLVNIFVAGEGEEWGPPAEDEPVDTGNGTGGGSSGGSGGSAGGSPGGNTDGGDGPTPPDEDGDNTNTNPGTGGGTAPPNEPQPPVDPENPVSPDPEQPPITPPSPEEGDITGWGENWDGGWDNRDEGSET